MARGNQTDKTYIKVYDPSVECQDIVDAKYRLSFLQLQRATVDTVTVNRPQLVHLMFKLAAPFDCDLADRRCTEAVKAAFRFWDVLANAAHKEPDQAQISQGEYILAMREVFLDDPVSYRLHLRPLYQAMFSIIDPAGDGVDVVAFTAWQRTLGVGTDRIREAFNNLDIDNDGRVSVDELDNAAQEFFVSRHPDAAGNLLFGDPRHPLPVFV